MAPIYTNNTNHTNDTDDTHHTDNPTTIGRETSPSSFFLRNKNLGQTIKTASRARCRMARSRLSNFSRLPLSGHRCTLHSFPLPIPPTTATRSTGSQLPILPTLLLAPLVPHSSFPRHRYPLHLFPTPHSPNTASRSTRSPLLIPHHRYPLHSFLAPHSYGLERERHVHATSFCSR